MRTFIAGSSLLLCSLSMFPAIGQDSPRVTPTVQLIEKVGSAVVPLFTQINANSAGSGSGAVVHPAGYILTADHVTQNFPGVALFGLIRVPYAIVGRCPERDLAILKVDPAAIQAVMPLGRSDDLKAGEPIIVGGNPGGRGIVFSQGIVTSPSIDPSWPNVLVKSYWRTDMQEAQERQQRSTGGRPDFIQFDASSNRGNSGGPLISYDGHVVGIVATKSFMEEGVNWAIPADRIRLLLPYMLQPEVQKNLFAGLEIDPLSSSCVVSDVVQPSPAHAAGLQQGDQITTCNDQPLNSLVDWLTMLAQCKANDTLTLRFTRQGKDQQCQLTLTEYPLPKATSAEDKVKGLEYRLYKGRFAKMPDFANLQPTKTGHVEAASSDRIVGEKEQEFAIVFQGYVEFPEAGVYLLQLGSDDASRLYLNDRLVIDNDLPHPYQQLSRKVRVPQGLVPMRLEYAETSGDKALTLDAKREHHDTGKIPLVFYRDK